MIPDAIRVAYVDSSAVVAVAHAEPDSEFVTRRLSSFQRLVSSNLLEAEVNAAYAREGREFPIERLANIRWILPTRSLRAEIATVLQVGYLRGADLWHVANALYAARTFPGLAFITLDRRQQSVASALGFTI